ncbi:MFS transporter [Cytobacillus firmus]|uniref:MFS transporter n=1 Tax=Cytobacillus firmus TaxID=1399 RepID=UPI0021897DCC|nr:MFS transporter [Cytobacillus firmus]URM33205.1 MFS transporter [Cytobacillus firmus]
MKSKSFRFLWVGQLFANLGDVFYIVGLISILYSVTESSMYLVLLPFLNMLGRFISGAISPLLFKKFRLKSLLVSSQLSKTAVLLTLSFWVSLYSISGIWLIMICIFMIAFSDGWALPATDAFLPRLVEQDELMKANSFVSVLAESIQLGGWALGGVLVAMIGGKYVIWLTFSLYVISTILMQLVEDKTSIHSKGENLKTLDTLLEGWIKIWKNPILRSIHIMISIEALANVVWIAAILYVFVIEILNVTEEWWGYINTAFFIGLILGGLVCSKFSFLLEKSIKITLLTTSFGVSIVTLIFGLNYMNWIALILVFLSGFIHQIKGITIHTYLQKITKTEDLPKIYSAQHTLVSLVFGFSTLIFGGITEYVSVQLSFIIAGLLLVGSGFYLVAVRQRFTLSNILKGEEG